MQTLCQRPNNTMVGVSSQYNGTQLIVPFLFDHLTLFYKISNKKEKSKPKFKDFLKYFTFRCNIYISLVYDL